MNSPLKRQNPCFFLFFVRTVWLQLSAWLRCCVLDMDLQWNGIFLAIFVHFHQLSTCENLKKYVWRILIARNCWDRRLLSGLGSLSSFFDHCEFVLPYSFIKSLYLFFCVLHLGPTTMLIINNKQILKICSSHLGYSKEETSFFFFNRNNITEETQWFHITCDRVMCRSEWD